VKFIIDFYFIIIYKRKKEGIKPSSVTTNSPLHTTEEGLSIPKLQGYERLEYYKRFYGKCQELD
jgi:hypothetical protein